MKVKNSQIKLNSQSRLYGLNYPIIGITGGIATGKTTVSRYLISKNFSLIDADKIVKEIYASEFGMTFITSNFSSCLTNNQVNFAKLRELFFKNKQNQQIIENFIFTHYESFFKRKIQEFGDVKFVFYDVPLLFEKNLEQKIDINLLVTCKQDNQIKRLIQRDHITQDLAFSIIQKQMPLSMKEQKAQYIIHNDLTQANLLSEVENFLTKIFEN